MKLESQCQKPSLSKQKETKRKGTAVAEASQSRLSKQTIINKSQNVKSPSSVSSNSKKLDAKSPTKKSKERNLESVRTKEEKSRKREKEEEQKKPKSNGTKSPTQEAKRRKENKVEPEKKNSQAKTSARNSSAGTLQQTSVKRGNSSSKSEKGKNQKKKEIGTHKKVTNSIQVARAKNHDSFSQNAGPSRSKSQTQTVMQKKPRASSSVKIHPKTKDVGKNKSPKATKNETRSTTLVEKSRESSAQCLKIMRSLGVIPPAESPFIRNGARL